MKFDNVASAETTPVSQQLAESSGSKYRLLAELGRGGMSDVYLALMTGAIGFSKLVVLKRLEPALAKDAEFMQMFLDEARLAARLNHPNVVQTHEVGYAEGRYFIAMEYLEGQPLNRILRQSLSSGGITLAAQLRILADALNGLHYAHELQDFDGSALGVVHRDVSPQNVFVTYDGQVKVVDFGVAKAVTRSTDSSGGMIRGKIAYMAPEQARAETVDRRADVFSMGVMLWEIAARRRMWKGKNVPQILGDLVAGRVPELAAFAPEAAPELIAICARATAAAAELRYESAAEFRAELESAIERLEPKPGQSVGAQVSQMFAQHRLQVRALIETQLGHLRLGRPGSPELEGELPLLNEPEAPSSGPPTERTGAETTLHSSVQPSLEPTAYGVHWSSIPPPGFVARSQLQRRRMAVLAVTGTLAFVGVFALITVMPRGSEPRPNPQAAASPGAYVAPPSPAIAPAPATPTNQRSAEEVAPTRDERRRAPAREPSTRRKAQPEPQVEARSELLIAPIRRQKRSLDKDDPWK